MIDRVMITNCRTENNGKSVVWEYRGNKITKTYAYVVYFELSKDRASVIIVEPDNEYSPDNAVIYNGDGTEWKRIVNPCRKFNAICFGDVYFEKGNITLISVCPRVNYACSIDDMGEVLKVHETR